ncbi:Poly(A)+ RNA export protein [Xylariaceae sp. AK1471]|nr:Poly(A)+ RNA export protein [Xylariaceae sp. AK1471]
MAYPSTSQGSLDNDIAVPPDGEDTITSLAWSPVADHLAASSWDCKVRIYDVSSTGRARGVAMLSAEGPIFGCDWVNDGDMLLAGGADQKIHLLDLASGQQTTIGSHDAPVRGICSVDVPGSRGPIVASGSWDGTVKFWDVRTSGSAVATLSCKERVYALDSKAQLLVIATAEQHIHLVDLKNPTQFLRTLESPLKYQTKAVSCFPDGKGWVTASIGGRVGINCLNEADDNKESFTFKCHRDPMDQKRIIRIWAINDVDFHPVHKTTFSTAGSDGTFTFWDRASKSRVSSYPPVSPAAGSKGGDNPISITATSFNRDGRFFAYAVGYDWSRGCAGNHPQNETKVVIHPVEDEDAIPKSKARALLKE